MSHIVNAPNSSNEDKVTNINMSILEEGFDQVPVVRSFLLQQILRTRLEKKDKQIDRSIVRKKRG